ncbi:hypothetical protein OSB04_022042 [Centaurea solstitialis]|uniref:Uncharacterized protein n=1 Tax=Centaurea solstitialis TaxID=347529 RepID=A0AA38WGU6_9ASTR|nr:hypothetical protein OSB04_022042 [Centaurea solstitialis]
MELCWSHNGPKEVECLGCQKLLQSSSIQTSSSSSSNGTSRFREDGCKHYRRRCMIRAPCCNEIFGCRHCHNETTNVMDKPSDRHDLVRFDVKQRYPRPHWAQTNPQQFLGRSPTAKACSPGSKPPYLQNVICSVCDTEQPVARVCTNCGVNMGEYFCEICKFYDDDTDKGQFHCDDCGICRVGGRDNFYHCKKCGSCYSLSLRDKHTCVENSMRHHCPICYEYLFDSLKDTHVMKCGHTIHHECFQEMITHQKYSCPVCSKSALDMSSIWKRIDEEIEATLMPDAYRHKKVWILCNDCNDTTEVLFHILGQKCVHCNSYNTRTIGPPVLPQE